MIARLSTIRRTVQEILELSVKSASLADNKSKLFCQQYGALTRNSEACNSFLSILSKDYGLRSRDLYQTIRTLSSQNADAGQFEKSFGMASFNQLNVALRPDYYTLFSNLGRVKDGVFTLVKIREDILNLLANKKFTPLTSEEEENLKIMKYVLKQLLSLWFTSGLLNIEQITWKSPAVLVEKVAHYERVHQFRTLNDLKNRLSSNRRCFVYTHPTMPNEPLVTLHIALTNSVSSDISTLISIPSTSEKINEQTTNAENEDKTNAIFYSINSCQRGLKDIELGNSLIKSCVKLLLQELPNLRNFHTLSPIPNFKDWLDSQFTLAAANQSSPTSSFDLDQAFSGDEYQQLRNLLQVTEKGQLAEQLRRYLNSPKYKESISRTKSKLSDEAYDGQLQQIVSNFMLRTCAFYLCRVKKSGFALNDVCNFHLKNGAQIYRINYGGNLSDKGIRSSYGMMANYGYDLSELDANCINYLTEKSIRVSDQISPLLTNFKVNL